jgi:hypothetical protein
MEAPAQTTSAAAPAAAAPAQSNPAPAGNPEIPVNGNGTVGTSSVTAAATAVEGWTKGLDADMQDFVKQKGFVDTKAVLESYRNLEKLRGVPQERLLKLPDPNAGADAPEWGDVFNKLGKPATPEGYGLKPTDPKDPQFTDWAKNAFHKMNLTTAQGQELVKQFNEFNSSIQTKMNEEHAAKITQQIDGLKKEWGAAHDQNIARARNAYKQFGIPDTAIDSLEKSIGFDGVMKMFYKLGTQVGEHEYLTGGAGSNHFGEGTILTPDQAQARIRALKQDREWGTRYTKGGVSERAEMERLMKMAFPT